MSTPMAEVRLKLFRNIFIVLVAMTANVLFAAGDEPPPRSRWSLEGSFQSHSVAGPSSPWMGFGFVFRAFDILDLGVRGYLPVTKPFDQSTYSLQAFARAKLYRGASTELFIEPDYAMNFYTVIPFTSFGVALGAATQLSPGLMLGISGGIEMAKVVVDSIGLEQRDTLIVYPRIALFANFNF